MRRLGLHEAGHRSHDRPAPRIDGVGAEDLTGAVGGSRLHHEIRVEALARAQPVRRNLMAHRARHAVGRQPAQRGVTTGDRQVRKHLALSTGRALDARAHRHVARAAFILDGG
jgi:hypothetical protein